MQRREFMIRSSSALAAGVATLSCAHNAAFAREPRDIKKCLKFGMVQGDGSIEEKFALLKRLGFDGVELDSPNNLDTQEILDAQEATGLKVPGVIDSVHWKKTLGDPDPKVRAEGLAALETALRDSKAYGGHTVLLVPAVVNAGISYEDAYNRSQEEIRKALPLAKELGVKIAIENVWNNFLLSPLEARRYIDEFESDDIGWFMDIGNIVNYGWPEHWIRTLGKRILRLDIKEYSRKKRDGLGLWKGFDVELLEGDCNWPEVMKAIDEIGYRGWMSAEVGGGGEDRLREISERMDKIRTS